MEPAIQLPAPPAGQLYVDARNLIDEGRLLADVITENKRMLDEVRQELEFLRNSFVLQTSNYPELKTETLRAAWVDMQLSDTADANASTKRMRELDVTIAQQSARQEAIRRHLHLINAVLGASRHE